MRTCFLLRGALLGLYVCLFAVSFCHASSESKSAEADGVNEEKHLLKGFLPHFPAYKKPHLHFPKDPILKKPILPKPVHHKETSHIEKKPVAPLQPYSSSSFFKKFFHHDPIFKKPFPHVPIYKKPLPYPIPTLKKPFFKKPFFKKPFFKKPLPPIVP